MKKFIFFARLYSSCLILAFPLAASAQLSDPFPNYVVIGAFAHHKNAVHFTDDANKNNFPARFEMNPNRNLYYVYVLSTADREHALAEALKFRTDTKYFDTWVYNGVLGDMVLSASPAQHLDLNPVTGESIESVQSDQVQTDNLSAKQTNGLVASGTSDETIAAGEFGSAPTEGRSGTRKANRNAKSEAAGKRSTRKNNIAAGDGTSITNNDVTQDPDDVVDSNGNPVTAQHGTASGRQSITNPGNDTQGLAAKQPTGNNNDPANQVVSSGLRSSAVGKGPENAETNSSGGEWVNAESVDPATDRKSVSADDSGGTLANGANERGATVQGQKNNPAAAEQSTASGTNRKQAVDAATGNAIVKGDKKTTATQGVAVSGQKTGTGVSGDKKAATESLTADGTAGIGKTVSNATKQQGSVSDARTDGNVVKQGAVQADNKDVAGQKGVAGPPQKAGVNDPGNTDANIASKQANGPSGTVVSTDPGVSGELSNADTDSVAEAMTKRAPKKVSTAPLSSEEVVGKNFYFHLFRGDNLKMVEGEVDAIDFEKSRRMATYAANTPVKVIMPAGKSKHISFVSQVFGYRKLQKEFDPANPPADAFLDEDGNLVVPFELVRLQKGDIAIMYNVFFFKDAAVMRPESRFEVNNLLDLLNENPSYKIRIHGHTNGNATGKIIRMDKPGNFYSLSNTSQGFGSAKKLSEERAIVIREYLISSGVSADRMDVRAWGGKKPIHDKHSVRANENVRVEIEILSDNNL